MRINLQHDVQFEDVTTGLEAYRCMPQALPERDMAEVDLSGMDKNIHWMTLPVIFVYSSFDKPVGKQTQIPTSSKTDVIA